MNLYEAQFASALDVADAPAPLRSVLLASSPRCGSHMIGHAMAGTGHLGVPFEYLNPANLAEWRTRLGTVSASGTLKSIMARRTTANGVFAIKAHFNHAAELGGVPALLASLPNVSVVHLRRADVLRQAVSYAIARQTGVWITGQTATSATATYDADLIADCLDDIVVQNARWTSAFEDVGIRPLNLYYEDASLDLGSAIRAIARVLGVDERLATVPESAVTRRQGGDARTEAWVRAYAQDRRTKASTVLRVGRAALRPFRR